MCSENIPCDDCTLRSRCKPSYELKDKLACHWFTCNAYLSWGDKPITDKIDAKLKELEGNIKKESCWFCVFKLAKCNCKDSPNYNKHTSWHDTCNCFKHWDKKERS